MRILRFTIDGQKLRKDPTCDFTHIIEGSVGYLTCNFLFNDSDWEGCRKVVEFIHDGESEFFEIKSNVCEVPKNVSSGYYFKVRLHGVKDNFQISTNPVTVTQER